MKDGVIQVQVLVDGNEGLLAEKPDVILESFALAEVMKGTPVYFLYVFLVLGSEGIPVPKAIFYTLITQYFPGPT